MAIIDVGGGGGGHLAPTMRSHALNTGGVGITLHFTLQRGLCVCVGGGGGGRHCHSTGVNKLVCRLSVHRLN